MNYEEILDYHNNYGTTKEDILKRSGYQNIIENVVIAPWWDVDIFKENHQITRIDNGLYLVENKDYRFNFIELKAIGAPIIMDTVMHLGVTNCEKIIFIGSAGALCDDLSIGDIVIPKYSISGEGVSRYLNPNLEDDFGKKFFPDQEFNNCVLKATKNICHKYNINFEIVPNYTVDTIFLQFAHIEYIKSLGAKTIEMETSAFFKAASITGIKASAIFVISDNSITKAGLYAGRNNDDKIKRTYAKEEIIPVIIQELFKKQTT